MSDTKDTGVVTVGNVRVPYPSSTEFSEMWYEDAASKTQSMPQSATPNQLQLLHACIGILTEAGELADPIKKHVFYGKLLTVEDRDNIAEELGDMLWYMAILCNYFGWNFQDLMWSNINKLAKRYPNLTFTSEDALARADKSGEGEG